MLDLGTIALVRLQNFLHDEKGGERDALTTLLILALIIIPLVLVVIAFGDQIKSTAEEAWNNVIGKPVGS